MTESALGLFEGYGIELELMIVDAETLAVRPLADQLLAAAGGEEHVERGAAAWSNELQLHVIEMKTNGPVPRLESVAALFQAQVAEMEALLAPMGARLLPTGMHPFMDPVRELKLWPHANDDIYRAFDRIFDCRGHGWANLQSLHLNLPFANDEELFKLHAATRLLLPVLPALAASSPVVEGRLAPELDHRLAVYRQNADRVPSVGGVVIPEPIYTRAEYERDLLGRIYRDLAPHDPEGILREEWVNARGAIARFSRMALEIRTLDVQEHPGADLAVATAVVAALRALIAERWAPLGPRAAWGERRLARIHDHVIRDGGDAVIEDLEWLESFGLLGKRRASEVWSHLVEATVPGGHPARGPLEVILKKGCLAERIRAAVGTEPETERIRAVYLQVADALREGRAFLPEAA